MWSVWGPKLLPYWCLSSWVLPRCTKCLPCILNKPQDHLCASWSVALLFLSYYSAWGPPGCGWMDGLWIGCVVGEGRNNRHGWVERLKLVDDIPCDYGSFLFSFITRWSWLKAPLASVLSSDASNQGLTLCVCVCVCKIPCNLWLPLEKVHPVVIWHSRKFAKNNSFSFWGISDIADHVHIQINV